MTCGVGRRGGLDLTLLWLWCRPAATALIQLLDGNLHKPQAPSLKKKKKVGGMWDALRVWDGNAIKFVVMIVVHLKCNKTE